MKTEVKPTIAWLWERLQDDLETSSVFSDAVKDRLGYTESIESLRQQLLEQCRKVQAEGLEIEYTTFGIDGFIISEQSFEGVRIDNTNSAKEMGCAYLFWAWELEQREKEASGD